MRTEKTNDLLDEIVSSRGFINIDQGDIDRFKASVGEIDAGKFYGKNKEIGVILENAISSIKKRHEGKRVKRLLFVIRLSQEETIFMEHIGDVNEMIDKLGEEAECQWGLSTTENLRGGQMELIVVIGF